jgi:hypothetical protein
MKAMHVLRFAAVLALAVWLGGLVALGITAPTVFSVVAAHNLAEGRVLAGAIFGEILRRFHEIAYACGAVVIVSLVVRRILGPRPRRFGIRFAVGLAMVAAALYSGLVVRQKISRVQEEIGVKTAASSLPAEDPRRIAFAQLHRQSELMQLIPLAGACVLLFLELSDHES